MIDFIYDVLFGEEPDIKSYYKNLHKEKNKIAFIKHTNNVIKTLYINPNKNFYNDRLGLLVVNYYINYLYKNKEIFGQDIILLALISLNKIHNIDIDQKVIPVIKNINKEYWNFYKDIFEDNKWIDYLTDLKTKYNSVKIKNYLKN